MVDRPSNPAPQSQRQNQSNPSQNKRIKGKINRKLLSYSVSSQNNTNLSSEKPRRRLGSMVAISILLTSAGLISMFAWLSILFICNPQQLDWLNRTLPEWAKISLN